MLEELFCAHRAELTAYCRGLCRSDAAAQDMVCLLYTSPSPRDS